MGRLRQWLVARVVRQPLRWPQALFQAARVLALPFRQVVVIVMLELEHACADRTYGECKPDQDPEHQLGRADARRHDPAADCQSDVLHRFTHGPSSMADERTADLNGLPSLRSRNR